MVTVGFEEAADQPNDPDPPNVDNPPATSSPPATGTAKLPCNCAVTPCYSVFADTDIKGWMLQYLELEKAELNLVLLGKIAGSIHMDSETCSTKKKSKERSKTCIDYHHHGHRICREFFQYLHGIESYRLTALVKHYKTNGVTPVP